MCALLAWTALLEGDPAGAGRLLDASGPTTPRRRRTSDGSTRGALWAGALQQYVAMPAVSPYDLPFASAGLEQFRGMLERRVEFDRLGVDGDEGDPMLLVGAVDVLSGEFRAFNSRREAITADMILASAAIPTLFRAVHLDGGTYWDGLFSQNPPIRELLDAKPDEIWVIQINPRDRETEPTTVLEIADRRNELAGNLSLHQELHFIEKIDELLEEGRLVRDGAYKSIMVRVVELSRSRISRSLGAVSKLNRDPEFIAELIAHGERRADEFLAALAFERAWRARDADAVMGFFADDAELLSAPPFPDEGPHRGADAIGPFVRGRLTTDIAMDTTRKLVARDRVAWTVRLCADGDAAGVRGHAAAEFRDGRITGFRLGPRLPAVQLARDLHDARALVEVDRDEVRQHAALALAAAEPPAQERRRRSRALRVTDGGNGGIQWLTGAAGCRAAAEARAAAAAPARVAPSGVSCTKREAVEVPRPRAAVLLGEDDEAGVGRAPARRASAAARRVERGRLRQQAGALQRLARSSRPARTARRTARRPRPGWRSRKRPDDRRAARRAARPRARTACGRGTAGGARRAGPRPPADEAVGGAQRRGAQLPRDLVAVRALRLRDRCACGRSAGRGAP